MALSSISNYHNATNITRRVEDKEEEAGTMMGTGAKPRLREWGQAGVQAFFSPEGFWLSINLI